MDGDATSWKGNTGGRVHLGRWVVTSEVTGLAVESWLVSRYLWLCYAAWYVLAPRRGVLWQSPAGHSLSPDSPILTRATHPFPSVFQFPVIKWFYFCPHITLQTCQNWYGLPENLGFFSWDSVPPVALLNWATLDNSLPRMVEKHG